MKNVGIDAIDYYIPNLFVDMQDLSLARDIPYEKLSQGLGLKKMSIPDSNEDTASLAANALLELITKNKINPSDIGRIYLGTETGLDSSKPISSYVIEIVEDLLSEKFGSRSFKNCDIVDLTFACAGAVDALQNCCDWVRNGHNRQAIVIASDIAKYELNSTGEYTIFIKLHKDITHEITLNVTGTNIKKKKKASKKKKEDIDKIVTFKIQDDTVESITETLQKLEDEMFAFAKKMEFEKAAVCRDKITSLKRKLIDL